MCIRDRRCAPPRRSENRPHWPRTRGYRATTPSGMSSLRWRNRSARGAGCRGGGFTGGGFNVMRARGRHNSRPASAITAH
eukprot:5891985-Prymnesium_polylepis.1